MFSTCWEILLDYWLNDVGSLFQAVLETVARVRPKKNETNDEKYVFYPRNERLSIIPHEV